ncbi:MAG: hypothetical protein LC746_17360 [Acidobacteria bacterium]|nr:hypothetical protein [Acidobacteriota bacterium]
METHLKRNRARALCASLLALALLASACSQQLKSLSDLSLLRNALISKYGCRDVNVTLQNGGALAVQLINSQFNSLDEPGRRAKAQEIAAFARDHFASIATVSRIWVAFLRGETYFYVVHDYAALGVYVFDRSRVEAGDLETLYERDAAARAAGVETKPTAAYSESSGTTTVSVNHIQLYGTIDDGLMLLPEFYVRGRKVSAPDSVDFEFLSYSKRRVFSEDDRLSVFADGEKLLAARKPRISTNGRGVDGTYSEIISHTLSYKEFARIADAREVKFKLGPKEIVLDDEQLGLLRGMKACVDRGGCP